MSTGRFGQAAWAPCSSFEPNSPFQSEVPLTDSLGLPELLERLREHEADRDHHHDCLGEEAHAALVQLTSVHRRAPEVQLLLSSDPVLAKRYTENRIQSLSVTVTPVTVTNWLQ